MSINWKPATAIAFVMVTAACSLIALADLAGAALPPFNGATIGFSEPHDQRAFDLLASPERRDTRLEDASKEAQAAIVLSPYNNAARARLAFIDAERHSGNLTSAGLKQLALSYDLVPMDHTIAAWRVGFALEHWGQLTPEIRQAVESEAMAFARSRSRDVSIRPVLNSIHNPEGRLAAALWSRSLKK